MKSTIKLPRPHLSWSQIDLWNRNRNEYIQRYFYGKESFTNEAMEYGKKFATALETGETEDEIIKLATIAIPRYSVSEYRLQATLKTDGGDIPLLGFIDTSYDPPSDGIREYKTGKVPWTQKKVDRHGQLTLYALMIYLNEKKLPKTIHLDWLETEDRDGELSITGRIQSFETQRAYGEIIEMTTIIKRTAAEISAAYNSLIQSIL